MSSITKKTGLTFIFCIFLIVNCKKYDDTQNLNAPTPDLTQSANTNNAANLAKDNTEELQEIIKLPFEPDVEATVWREISPANDGNNNQNSTSANKKLIAVMKFSAEDAQKLVELAATHQPPPQPVETAAETWFPPELVAVGGVSGNETLKGTVYSAEDFLKAPYMNGRLIKVDETDYFILELTAM